MKQRVEQTRILISGGAGFIGSNLAERLLEQDNEVVVLDNFATGHRENLAAFAGHPRFTLIEGDLRDRNTCGRAVDGVDYVLHQAALGSVPRSVADPETTTEVNVAGFVNLLHAAQQAGVRRFVYASSSSVYGDSPVQPKRETELGRQLSPYAVGKYADELFADNFSRLYGIETIGLRYFNVFGRRQDPRGAYAAVIPRFLQALLSHTRPVIYGDGTNSRDFTYIDNVIRANELALLAAPAAANTVYNVACGEALTLNQLFAEIRSELAAGDPAAAALEPEYAPPRTGDIAHSLADITKARRGLGYEPEIPAREGLRETVRWYRRQPVRKDSGR